MAATGNVKISELTNHSFDRLNGAELLPLSWSENGDGSYESFKMSLQDVVDYAGAQAKPISYLERDLGQYEGTLEGNFCDLHSSDITIATFNSYITRDGETGNDNNWGISAPLSVKEGTLYLLQLPDNFNLPDGRILFAKRHVHEYYPITGYRDVEVTITHEDGSTETITVREPIYSDEPQVDVVYEPRSFHYSQTSDHQGYGLPKSNFVVFLAPEDEDIVISAPRTSMENKKLYATHYGVFSEIAEKFLGSNSDLTMAISEAIAELDGRVSACEAAKDSLGDGTAHSLDVMTMPKFRGGDMVVVSDHMPMTSNYQVDEYGAYITSPTLVNHAPDYANHAGQMWSENGRLWIASGPSGNWYRVDNFDVERRQRLSSFSLDILKKAVADQNLEKYGLKVGDQTTINGRTYVIAGLNPMKGTTKPYRLTQNHVGLIVIPHVTQKWNESDNTSTGAGGRGAGYLNSDLHYYLEHTLLPLVETDLGAGNLLGHSKLLTNAVNTNGYNRFGSSTGCSSNWTWESNCKIAALSEVQVYGSTIWSSSGYDTGEACRQLDVFRVYNYTEIFGGEYPWLRDIASATHAASANDYGNAALNAASDARYVAALIIFN